MRQSQVSASCDYPPRNTLLTSLSAIERSTGFKPELALVDLGDFNSVVQCAEKYKNDSLDILVANAGIAVGEYETTKDGWESTSVTIIQSHLMVMEF